MNKEELKQEAEQDAGNVSGLSLSTTIMVSKDKTDAYRLGRFDGYLLGAEPREKRIEELEKENTELKETVIKMNNVITETFSNLTKGKELLKEWLQANICDSVVLFSETEQFLSEVEK